MTTKNQSHLTPREVARVLFRQWRKTALFCFATIALTLLAITLYPRSYSSEAMLFIRVGRESVALDPTATTGQTITLQKTQVNEVNSALQVLASREVYRRVVERVGAERILKDSPAAGSKQTAALDSWASRISNIKARVSSWIGTALAGMRLSDPGTPEEMAVRRLESGLRSFAPKESTIISVNYYAASPELAHDVVAAVTDVFLEEHVRLNHTEGSLKFFSEQVDKLHQDLDAAQAELRDRKNKFKVASTESRRSIFAEQIQNVELELLNTQRELAFSTAEIADLARAIGGLAPELVTDRTAGFANQAKDLMREKLYELEVEESKLRARFKPDHPQLVQIQRQRKEAEAILANEPDDRTQTKAELNPNQRALELALMQTKARNEALVARQVAAEKQRGDLNGQLMALNEQEVQLDQLQQNVQLLDGKYRMHVEKLEQARVNDALGRERISNVMVAQPATLVGKPALPKKPLLAAFGLMVAVGGALALAFLSEIFDQTLRTTAQVESELGLPVLLSFPHRKRRRRRAKSSGAAADGEPAEVNGSLGGRYRSLARQLLHGNGNGRAHARTVGIVGCETSKSRSQVAAQLAIQAAKCGAEPVLLIDADARHRRVAKQFHLNGSPGWREVLAGVADAESCVHRAKSRNLGVMTAGGEKYDATCAAPIGGALAQLDEIKTDYALVVVDLPPTTELEPPASAGWLDEMVLVVEAEHTRIQSAQRAKEMLERAGVQVTGVVLANRREYIPRWLYQRL